MSQSDYIQYKKNQTVLKEQQKFQPVLASKDYTQYTTYAAETTFTTNTVPTLNQLLPAGKIRVMNIERKITENCPTFIICNNTNTRANRGVNLPTQIEPRPLRPLY